MTVRNLTPILHNIFTYLINSRTHTFRITHQWLWKTVLPTVEFIISSVVSVHSLILCSKVTWVISFFLPPLCYLKYRQVNLFLIVFNLWSPFSSLFLFYLWSISGFKIGALWNKYTQRTDTPLFLPPVPIPSRPPHFHLCSVVNQSQ